jgi:hypothetical protein
MTHAEQHRMINELRDAMRKMTRDDEEAFDMYVKRDKDDEFLDTLSQRRLEQMYERYIVRKGGHVHF